MALKLIQRYPLLRQFRIQRYPPVGPVCSTRLLRTSSVGEPSCGVCSCTSAGGCIQTQGCKKPQQDCGRRNLTTIIREPSFIASSSVGLHRDSGPEFRLTQLHPPTAAEEESFQKLLNNCSSSQQVLTLLCSAEIMSDTMAAAGLHRVADLEQGDKSLKDPRVLENDTIKALCFQLEQDSRRLTDAGLVSALLACTRLFLDPWSILMVRLVSESQERLDRGKMTLGQLCTLGHAMMAIEGPNSLMLVQVIKQIEKQKNAQWSLADLTAVYRFMQTGVVKYKKYWNLLKAIHTHTIKLTPHMDPAAVSGLLGALMTLPETKTMPLVISLCKQAVQHVPHFLDEELTTVLGALMHFGHSDHKFVEALERYVPTMAFTSDPETVTKVIQFFGRRNILSPTVFDAIAESFVYRASDYNTSQVARHIMALGKLGYLPPNAGEVFRKVESILQSRFSQFQPRTLLNLLHSCTLVKRYPVNFVSKVFSSYFLQQLQAGLAHLLGGRSFFGSKVLTPYCYTLDVELKLDEDGFMLPASHNKDVYKRMAVCIDGQTRFTTIKRQLLGKEAIKQRHLRLLGYEVVQIPYYEFEKLQTKSEVVEYLHQKLFPHTYRLNW
uniref:FAST kinase domains 3 n=1 Tax=Dicentrarchus labrax TaxID=13489 RepID=A0A8C4NV68_DICLA